MARRGHRLRHRGREGDDVVLYLSFDLVDAVHVEAGVLAQQPRGFGGHYAQFGQRLGGRQLDFEPLLKLFWSLQIRPISGRVYRGIMMFRIEKLPTGVRCSAIDRRVSEPRRSSAWPATSRTISG